MVYDKAFERASKIFEDANDNLKNISSEEDVKIQIINRILTEVLDWRLSDISAERKHDNGFSDYVLSDNDVQSLIIEAKRIELLDIQIAEKSKLTYLKLSGSALQNAIKGIEQAASYSQPNGLPISVLTDGITWIIFKTYIPSENYKDKTAYVFPSFEAVLSDFCIFLDLLHKEQFRKKIYNSLFDKIHQNRLNLSNTLKTPIAEDDISIRRKSSMAFDLEGVFRNYFSRLKGENDDELLVECFVESRESRIADFSLEKMTKAVLGNITTENTNVESELSDLIESSVEVNTGQTVFIVGPTGAGKTTFLDRFFRKTLSSSLRNQCLIISVNILDSTGTNESALKWLTETMISRIEKHLFKDGHPTWENLRGLYFSEYSRRKIGVDAKIYQKDPEEFRRLFSTHLEQLVLQDREEYLKRLLSDAITNRKLLPIIILDNTDEFSAEFKSSVFQFTQSIRRNLNHCILIFPATDKSAWGFSKTDIFGIYESKSFFLPTPSPREIFRKRIDYLKKKLSGDKSEIIKTQYLTERGIKISVSDLESFANVLENIFVDFDYPSKTIGELANYNIRRTLALSKRVITSSVFKIDDLVKNFINGNALSHDHNRFIDALMKGDYEVFRQTDDHEIYPIFRYDKEILHSPLLNIRILTLLEMQWANNRNIEDKHLSCNSIFTYFNSMSCTEKAVDNSLINLMEARLIEPFDPSIKSLSPAQRLAITFSGRAHLRLGKNNNVFFSQMALTTAISNEDIAMKIRSEFNSNTPFAEKMRNIRSEFWNYLKSKDQDFLSIPNSEEFSSQIELTQVMEGFYLSKKSSESYSISPNTNIDQFGKVVTETIAVVDFYDAGKNFGFLYAEGIEGRIHISGDKLQEFTNEQLHDGDTLQCDISRDEKGLHVDLIHNIIKDDPLISNCKIVKLFDDRGYGFVEVSDSRTDAFFHYSLFDEIGQENLHVGQEFIAEISKQDHKKGNQVKNIIE